MVKKENCPNCNSPNIRKNGWIMKKNKKTQRYQCIECGKIFQFKSDKSMPQRETQRVKDMDIKQ